MEMKYDDNYFKNRKIEGKHYIMVLQWLNSLDLPSETGVLDYGCGTGPFVEAFRYYGVKAFGYDPYLPENLLKHKYLTNEIGSFVGSGNKYDFVICMDVLEHLRDLEIRDVILECKHLSKKYVLFSICMAGDPNWELDETHKTYWSKSRWVYELESYGLKVINTPENWWFKDQIILCEVKNES